MECSPISVSLHAQDDCTNQPKLDLKSTYNDTRRICHRHPGSKDCYSLTHISLDETNDSNVAAIDQISHLAHCGPLQNVSILDSTRASSTQHVLWKDEMSIIDACNEKGAEHQIERKSSVYESSENILEGLHNVAIDSFEKSAAESSPLTVVKFPPSMHPKDDIAVGSDSDPVSCRARGKREQLIHAYVTPVTVGERKHILGMRKPKIHQSRQEAKYDKVGKRGRRSSKAVKFDECMNSFRAVTRKRRSIFPKAARTYAWWFYGKVEPTPKIDKVAVVSENESRKECGSNKSKKVGTKRQPRSEVIGGKADSPFTCIRLKVKSVDVVDHNCSAALVSDGHDCLPPKPTDCILDVVKECGGLVKGESNLESKMKDMGNWPFQDAAHTSKRFGSIINDSTKGELAVSQHPDILTDVDVLCSPPELFKVDHKSFKFRHNMDLADGEKFYGSFLGGSTGVPCGSYAIASVSGGAPADVPPSLSASERATHISFLEGLLKKNDEERKELMMQLRELRYPVAVEHSEEEEDNEDLDD